MNEALAAKFLDEKVPGWEKEIDLDTLDLTNTCGCVLGQLVKRKRWRVQGSNPWEKGLRRLAIDYYSDLYYGFSGSASTAQWQRLIRYRLRKAAA